MRSFPFFWVKQEQLWYQVTWLVGRRDRLQEDYGPEWYAVTELEQGTFDTGYGAPILDARRVEEPERDLLWAQFGPPV